MRLWLLRHSFSLLKNVYVMWILCWIIYELFACMLQFYVCHNLSADSNIQTYTDYLLQQTYTSAGDS